jgi:flagellar operon protein
MSTIDQIYFPNPIQPAGRPAQPAGQPVKPVGDSPFARVLDQTTGVKFSQHAQDRLKARNISFSSDQLQQLEGAVNSVAQKGGKESLVMMGDAALVVSVKNRTVVTAMDRSQMRGNVFTNIDSAVVI